MVWMYTPDIFMNISGYLGPFGSSMSSSRPPLILIIFSRRGISGFFVDAKHPRAGDSTLDSLEGLGFRV